MGDTNWSFVKLLNHFNGADNSTLFTNFSGIEDAVQFSRYGSPLVKIAIKQFGTGSLYTGASGSNCLRSPDSNTFGVGSADFTIEGWFAPSASGDRFWWVHGRDVADGLMLGVSTTKVQMRHAIGTDLSAAVTLSTSVPTHVVFQRRTGVRSICVNGVQVASDSTAFTNNGVYPLDLGASPQMAADTNRYYGYIDELRASFGLARYVAPFTVPVAEFDAFEVSSTLTGVAKFSNGAVATIARIYRSDTGKFVKDVTPNATTGAFSTTVAVYGPYDVTIFKPGYRPLCHGPIYPV